MRLLALWELRAPRDVFDLVHHPHEADGVVVRVAICFSPPSLLTDPGQPDGVAEILPGLSDTGVISQLHMAFRKGSGDPAEWLR